MASRVVARRDVGPYRKSTTHYGLQLAELQAALQKRELKEHADQHIGREREVKEAHRKWLNKNKPDRRRNYGNEATKTASVARPSVLPSLGFWMAASHIWVAGLWQLAATSY